MTNVLFRLREYDDAFRDLFGRVMRAHAEEACAASTTFAGREVIVTAPGLSASKEDPDRASTGYHTSQVTLPSGEPLKNEPFDMKVPFRFNLSDMINGDVDAFTTSVEASGVGRQYPVRAKTMTFAVPLGTLQAMRGGFKTGATVQAAQATRTDLLLETLALRHQLGVLARSHRRIRPSD